MKISVPGIISLIFTAISLLPQSLKAQGLKEYQYRGALNPSSHAVSHNIQFNGYTNYWQDNYRKWFRYGNLFKMSVPDLELSIAQSKVDAAEDMQVPGLWMQEGFINGLLTENYQLLEDPSAAQLENAVGHRNLLALVHPDSEAGKKLLEKYPKENLWKQKLKSHQFAAANFTEINAFFLENSNNKIFVIATKDKAARDKVKLLIGNTLKVVKDFDLHKGWFGAQTLLKSVTITPGHPLDLIAKGLNEGNTWFVFSGYMEFLAKEEIDAWVAKTRLPIVTDVGFSPIYGLKDYEGLQVQDMGPGQEGWINFARKKGGYIFRPVYDPESDAYKFDGYIAEEGNKEQIDKEDVPFIANTGQLSGDLLSSMVLFIKKGERLTKERMWEAIMSRREVAVLKHGKMMGPQYYRNALQMLLLDRVFLEDYYGDRLDLQANVEGYTLNVSISNTNDQALTGRLDIELPGEIIMQDPMPDSISLPANSTKNIKLKIRPLATGMNRTNAVVVKFNHAQKQKTTLAMLDLPPAISVNQLLYGHTPRISFPVTIHNFSAQQQYAVEVQVFKKDKPGKAAYTAKQIGSAATGSYQELNFNLELPPGDYDVNVSALGVSATSQLGVGKAEPGAYLYEQDLNADGIKEYRLENDSVQVTLLATGARVIEYIVKSRKDNILFKLWPEKAIDDKQPFRYRGYYPYGGFEDFLGQGSMETHQVYDVEVIRTKGDYVQVRMVADYFGNRLEKIFTLYGNSPLLEIRFALNFINPEANVIGPQPILELGKAHGTEDVFMVPAREGIKEYRMKPEDYYGGIINLKEGWNAGYDTREDIAFVGAYPVKQPLFLHMWMNHPRNPGARYYYTEFQLWTPIIQKSTMYFTYYMWGTGGGWQKALEDLRKRNLITNMDASPTGKPGNAGR